MRIDTLLLLGAPKVIDKISTIQTKVVLKVLVLLLKNRHCVRILVKRWGGDGLAGQY